MQNISLIKFGDYFLPLAYATFCKRGWTIYCH